MKKTRQFFSLTIMALLLASYDASAQSESPSKLAQSAATVIQRIESRPDRAIPRSLLRAASCVATLPNVRRIGFVIGVSYGDGLVSCRTQNGWSDPIFFSVKGGSWGFQIGLDSTAAVLVFVGHDAIQRVGQGNFTIGGDLSVAAGPLGRDAQAGVDYRLKSEVYSYSHSRGLFAGLTINGTAFQIESKENRSVYGAAETARQILLASSHHSYVTAPYVEALVNFAN